MKPWISIFVALWMFTSAHAQFKGFTENRGQVSDQDGNARPDVLYTAESGNTKLFITTDRIACVVKQKGDPISLIEQAAEKKIAASRFDLVFNTAPLIPTGQQPGYSNYYLAHCPTGITHVPSFQKLIYKNIYEKIDLHVSLGDAGLKLDLIVQDGGDPNAARINLEGIEGDAAYRGAGGLVNVSTAAGDFQFSMQTFFSDGKKVQSSNGYIEGAIEKLSPGVQPLTSTTWATYIGGSDSDDAPGLTLDGSGDAYIAGYTQSIDLPVGTGTVQDSPSGGYDAFIFKLDNATGNRVWATYYGGTGTDFGYKIKVSNSMPVMVGYGSSTDLPMTPGAWQAAAGGSYDGFIVKLNTNGTLYRTTYFGGPNGELLLAMDMDKAGNIFTGGSTSSTMGFPVTPGAFQPAHGGAMDAFCAKLDTSLALMWATYYGGSGSEDMHAMTLDTNANVIFSGGTYSSNFPVTPNAFQTASMGGGEPYIVKMDSSGARIWATYIGGYSNDDINGLDADKWNNIYAVGYSESLDFPVTGNAYQSSLAGASDAVIAKFHPNGMPAWITYYGGTMYDYATSVNIDTSDNIFIGGHTNSTNFPVSSGAFQTANAGSFDGFFLRFDTAQVFGWGTYFGGLYDENVLAIAVDDMWNVFIGGNTSSLDLPDTAGVMQPAAGGNTDGFAAKLDGSYGLTIGIHETVTNELKVYPNPASDIIFIDLPLGSDRSIILTDVAGRKVKTVEARQGQRISVDMSGLPPGLYFLTAGAHKSVVRVIKM